MTMRTSCNSNGSDKPHRRRRTDLKSVHTFVLIPHHPLYTFQWAMGRQSPLPAPKVPPSVGGSGLLSNA